jgi:chorismate mutase
MIADQIQDFRVRIDAVDRELVDALRRRVRLVVELWRLKQLRELPRRDSAREDEIIARLSVERSALVSEESLADFMRLVLWISREEANADADERC